MANGLAIFITSSFVGLLLTLTIEIPISLISKMIVQKTGKTNEIAMNENPSSRSILSKNAVWKN